MDIISSTSKGTLLSLSCNLCCPACILYLQSGKIVSQPGTVIFKTVFSLEMSVYLEPSYLLKKY